MLLLLRFLVDVDAELSSSCPHFLNGFDVLKTLGNCIFPAGLKVTVRTHMLSSGTRILWACIRLLVMHASVDVTPPQLLPMRNKFTARTMMLNLLFVQLRNISFPRQLVTEPIIFIAPSEKSSFSLEGFFSRMLKMPGFHHG
jgi:hypothetical protein